VPPHPYHALTPNRATLCAHVRPSNQGTLEYLALQSFSDDADAKASAKFENAKMLDHPNVAKVTHKPMQSNANHNLDCCECMDSTLAP
jgi:hypothetical protein